MTALAEQTTFRDWWNQEHIALPEVTESEFDDWGREVGKAYAFASWKAVDWATEAKERGYEYDRIAEILGRPEGSCRSLVKIGRAYPPVTRRYNLGPSFYDAAVTLPEGERGTALSEAIEQSYTRDQFRAFVGEFKRLRGIPEDPKPEQPAWNNGNGGRFGATADKTEKDALPKRETKPLEPDNTPDVFQGPDTQSPVDEQGRELVRAFNALSSEAAAELVKRGQVPEPSPHTTYVPDEPPTPEEFTGLVQNAEHWKLQADIARDNSAAAERHNSELTLEIERLRDTMASWADNQISLPDRTLEELRKRLGKYMLTHTESDWGISEFADYTLWKEWRPR